MKLAKLNSTFGACHRPTSTSITATMAEKSNGRRRMSGRLPTFDVVNDHSDGSVEQWSGSIIQFVRTRVAKRRCRLKNTNQLSLHETVLKVDMARVLGKMQLECLYNF